MIVKDKVLFGSREQEAGSRERKEMPEITNA
jgi:hypothetical protein